MVKLCDSCKGKGYTVGIFKEMKLDCPICNGMGYIGDAKDIALHFKNALTMRWDNFHLLKKEYLNIKSEMELLKELCPEYEDRKKYHNDNIVVNNMNSKFD